MTLPKRDVVLTAALIAAVAYVGSVSTAAEMLTLLFAVVFFGALAGYVLLSPEGNPAPCACPYWPGFFSSRSS